MAQYRGKIYRADRKDTATPVCMGLPIITSVTKTYDSDLTEIKTIVFGTDYNYCADLGVSTRYQITFERVNPTTVNDS